MSARRAIPLVLIAATLAAFAPAVTNEFSSWDDVFNIWQNPRLNPPTFSSIAHYWTHPAYGLYIPLTYTVWGLLAVVGRVSPDPSGVSLNPWIFHAASLFLHVAAVLLVYHILSRLIDKPTAAAIGALLFGLHPVQVESVAWAAGLKDVLSGTLALAAVWQYILYRQDDKRIHYILATAAFVLAMLAKPSAMVVPVIAFAVDYWLLRRDGWLAAKTLWPWAVLSVLCAVVARWVQFNFAEYSVPLWARPIVAADALAFYLWKIVWPAGLAIDYGHRPIVVIGQWWFWTTWIIPVAISIWLTFHRHRRPQLFVAAVIFLIAVAPVLGLTPFLFQQLSTTADHYLYVAMLGIALAGAWAVTRWPRGGMAAAVIVLPILAIRTAVQTSVWRDDMRLFSNTLKINPDSFVTMNNLARVYGEAEQYDRGAPLLQRALELWPNYPEAHENLALIYDARRDFDRAVQHRKMKLEILLRRPVEIRDDVVPTVVAIGKNLVQVGRLAEARRYFQLALEMRSDDADAIQGLKDVDKLLANSATQPSN